MSRHLPNSFSLITVLSLLYLTACGASAEGQSRSVESLKGVEIHTTLLCGREGTPVKINFVPYEQPAVEVMGRDSHTLLPEINGDPVFWLLQSGEKFKVEATQAPGLFQDTEVFPAVIAADGQSQSLCTVQ